jgi:hypothetical protein
VNVPFHSGCQAKILDQVLINIAILAESLIPSEARDYHMVYGQI